MFLEVLGLTYHSPITILAATSGALQRYALACGRTRRMSSQAVVSEVAADDDEARQSY
jgi:hypothetical protein